MTSAVEAMPTLKLDTAEAASKRMQTSESVSRRCEM